MQSKILLYLLGGLLVAGALIFTLSSCAKTQVIKPHGLTGGVVEPTDADYARINCWVQPPNETLWFPCPSPSAEDFIKQFHGH